MHSDGPGASITASTGTNWVDPKFDAAGNMTLGPRPGDEGDANDALVMVYDAWNRLVKIYDDDDADGVADADELIVTYYYDGLNRRIHKAKPRLMDEWEVWSYYYDTSWRVVEEQYDSRAQDPMEDDLLTKSQYVWDIRYIDAPVLRWRDTNDNGTLDETLYYCNDANMNVTALVNTSGTVVERYVYDAYGKVTFLDGSWGSRQSSSYGNEILYCGYRHDPETGLYQVRNRYHHPTLGRWVSRDPIIYDGGGMNVYEYVSGSPIKNTDWEGLREFTTEDTNESIRILDEDGANAMKSYMKAIRAAGKNEKICETKKSRGLCIRYYPCSKGESFVDRSKETSEGNQTYYDKALECSEDRTSQCRRTFDICKVEVAKKKTRCLGEMGA